MEKKKACGACGTPMEYRGYKHVETVGTVRVTDGTSFAWQCSHCGEVDLSIKDLGGYERRAAAVVLRDGRNVNGSAVRYARKALGLKQTDLAHLLDCTAETISRWENNALAVPRAHQLAIVSLLEGVETGTLALEDLVRSAREEKAMPSKELEVPPQVRRSA